MRQMPCRTLFCIITAAALLSACGSTPPEHFTQVNAADKFTPCSDAPHCVSSQAAVSSPRYIKPLGYAGDAIQARNSLVQVLSDSAGTVEASADTNFIHATFTSRLMGFVDDVSFIIQPQQHYIDVKSSSRIGYYDFGANRARVEQLRTQFEQLNNSADSN